MTATLRFKLPEEEREHSDAVNGWEWRRAIECCREQVKSSLKHGHQFKTADEALEWVFTIINTEISDVGVQQ